MNAYNTGLLARNMAGISSQAALDNAQQQQQNYQQVLGGQSGLAGQRTNLANALAQRQLTPYNTQAGMLGQNQGLLSNLLQMNNANNIYGVQQLNNPIDQFSAFGNAADKGILDAISLITSYGGSAGSIANSVPSGASTSGINGGDQVSGGSGGGGMSGFNTAYNGPSNMTLDPSQQYNPSSIDNSQIWGQTATPSFNDTGSGSFMGMPVGTGAASGFGAGGDSFAMGGGYGL